VDEIFTVMIKSKIQCDKCNFASTTFESALEVPLPVIPPSEKKVERKTINCLFIHQDASQKNILVTLAVEKETL
jgi:ubiquitin C-terminal hydrolase